MFGVCICVCVCLVCAFVCVYVWCVHSGFLMIYWERDYSHGSMGSVMKITILPPVYPVQTSSCSSQSKDNQHDTHHTRIQTHHDKHDTRTHPTRHTRKTRTHIEFNKSHKLIIFCACMCVFGVCVCVRACSVFGMYDWCHRSNCGFFIWVISSTDENLIRVENIRPKLFPIWSARIFSHELIEGNWRMARR